MVQPGRQIQYLLRNIQAYFLCWIGLSVVLKSPPDVALALAKQAARDSPALFRAILHSDTPPSTSNQLVAWLLSNQQLQRQSRREAVQAGRCKRKKKCMLSLRNQEGRSWYGLNSDVHARPNQQRTG